MDTLEKELPELKLFIADLKADRANQKEKEKRESWTKYVSMSIVFIAVLAAVATQRAGKYSSKTLVSLNVATFNQALASDQWSYYQASSIKQNMYEAFHTLPESNPSTSAEVIAKVEASFAAKDKKYSDAKDDAKKKATDYEAIRDQARSAAEDSTSHGGPMGLSVSIFQISIAMSSICLVTKKKWLWFVSLALALAATSQLIYGW